ncbi:rnhA, partial [Mucuna pruriens]
MELTPDGRSAYEAKEWFMFVDGASNQARSGAGNNNQEEYEALLVGMRLARELEAKVLTTKSDSKLVTGQVNGEYQVRDPQLIKYWERALKMAATFKKFTLLHVPRDQNKRADLLSKLASTQKRGQQRLFIHENLSESTTDKREVCCIEEKRTWMSPFLEYLKEDRLSSDVVKAKEVVKEASKYTLVGQQLYRKGFSFPLLRCEVHEGTCRTHIGGRALTIKITKANYYWPTLKHECMEYMKKCNKCQKFMEPHKVPQNSYTRSLHLGHFSNREWIS